MCVPWMGGNCCAFSQAPQAAPGKTRMLARPRVPRQSLDQSDNASPASFGRAPLPPLFCKSVIPRNFKSNEFVSVHSKGLAGAFLVSVHSKEVAAVEGRQSTSATANGHE